MNNVNITIDPNGLNASVNNNEDFKSGIVFYQPSIPAAFTAGTSSYQIFSTNDAEDLGITVGTFPLVHYHINRYFKQTDAPLYINLTETPSGTHDFEEVIDLARFAQGKLRQIGVLTSKTFSVLHATTLQSIGVTLDTNRTPAVFIYQGEAAGTSGITLSGLTDLRLLENNLVHVAIEQSGNGIGKDLFTSSGKTVGGIGDKLGCLSRSNVGESIGSVKNFNVMVDEEYDTLAFITGDDYDNVSFNLMDQLHDYHYGFLRKRSVTGSFYNDSLTAVATTSDLFSLERNRTIQKAQRNLYQIYEPEISGKLLLNSDGTIFRGVVASLEALGERALIQMVIDEEISGYSIFIDPAQKPATTSSLEIVITLVPVGIGRNINIKLKFGQ